MSRLLTAACVLAFLSATGLDAQVRPLKVLLLYDMEGVSEATDHKHTSFSYPLEYAFGRRSLTADVNAAIAGLKSAGATEIVVVDGHGSGNGAGPDVLEDQLLAPARMGYRATAFDIYAESYDQSFDAIVAVAMHAGAGNRVGFLSHTITFEDIEYKVNGAPYNESMLLAHGAARYRIPLIMVSGDDQLEKEVRRAMPWVKYAAVKHAADRGKAESVGREEASRRIEAAAREALQTLAEAKIPDWPGPYRFALTFQDAAQAQSAARLPGAELLATGNVVQLRAADFEEGYMATRRMIPLASAAGSLSALNAAISAQPNAAQIRVGLVTWLYDRFLDRLPPAPPAATPSVARFWGAR